MKHKIHSEQPFKVETTKYHKELAESIEEAKRLEAAPQTKRYTNMDEMWADLDEKKCNVPGTLHKGPF